MEKLAAVDSKYLKDLRINVSNVLNSPNLSKKEAYLIGVAVGLNEKYATLAQSFEELAKNEGATQEVSAEVSACVSLLNVNNIYYRFKHFTNKEFYNQTPAGIKMSIMAKPILGK